MFRFLFLFLVLTSNAFALSIVAKVDDAPISKFDLDNYIKLAIATGQAKIKPEDITKHQDKFLDQLIDQKVKLNDIENLGLNIPQEQIDGAIKNIEAQSRAKDGSLKAMLKEKGIPEDVLNEKLKVDIGWFQVLNYKFGKNITVSEDEVAEELKIIAAANKRPHISLYEIFIPVQSVLQDNEIYTQILDMISIIKKENNFSDFARQYSMAASRDKGGEIGWIPTEILPQEFAKGIANLKIGEVSEPIRTENGYYILLVKDKAEKTINGAGKISKEAVANMLQTKKLEQFAKKYINDLRNDSIIEKMEN